MSLSFVGRAGGDDPPAQFLTLVRSDGGADRWTLTVDKAWVQLSNTSDTLPFLVGVRSRTTGLPVGIVAGTIDVTMSGQVRVVPVTLELRATRSLTSRWIGVANTLAVTLTLIENAGVVLGTGSLSVAPAPMAVTGSYTTPPSPSSSDPPQTLPD